MRHTWTRRTGLAAAAAALLITSACGSAPSASSSTSGSGGSSSSTSSSSSASPSASASSALSSSDLFQKVYAAAVKAGTAHVTMVSTGQQGIKADGDVSYKGGTQSMQMTMDMAQMGGKADMRLVDGILYMQIPGMTPKGKYLEINPKDKSTPMGKAFGSMTGQMDPLKSLENLKGAITSVKALGQEQVDGTQTTHYQVVVDTKKLMAAMTKQLPQGSMAGAPKTITYDMWIDAQDLMHQIKFGMGGTNLTMQMTKWGEPVSIAKPPAGSIVKTPQG